MQAFVKQIARLWSVTSSKRTAMALDCAWRARPLGSMCERCSVGMHEQVSPRGRIVVVSPDPAGEPLRNDKNNAEIEKIA